MENLCAAAKSICARRVAESGRWRGNGDRSPAHWLARKAGTSIGKASDAIETARRIESLPGTDAAVRAGKLSTDQANEVASAAEADPTAEDDLLKSAEKDGLAGLKEKCRKVRARAAGKDESERHQAIHTSRYLRHWTDAEGAFHMDLKTTTAAGAKILAGLEAHRDQIFKAARKEGRRDSYEAYGADALLAMSEASVDRGDKARPGGRPKIIVRVDHTALTRGHAERGETCDIVGVGPVPVSVVRDMMDDAFLAALITRGQDVASVVHLNRKAKAFPLHQAGGVLAGRRRSGGAAIGVDQRSRRSRRRTVRTSGTRDHHDLKTRCDYRLAPGKGKRLFLPPGVDPPGDSPVAA